MANDLAIRRALESAGVEFIDENGGGPGVRLEAAAEKRMTQPAQLSGYAGLGRKRHLVKQSAQCLAVASRLGLSLGGGISDEAGAKLQQMNWRSPASNS